jgi:two-component system cell cycle sensor histidine kinase/response regulator CckA
MFRENRWLQTDGDELAVEIHGKELTTIPSIIRWHDRLGINACSGVGRGTTFRIFPPRLAETNGQKPELAELDKMPAGIETILLVEDDIYVRIPLSRALAQLGYRVLEAIDSVNALEVWSRNRDDIRLLLTDLIMPGGITGMELATELLKERPDLKVIYISDYPDCKDFRLQDGVNFLPKPFEMRELAQIIRNRLDM